MGWLPVAEYEVTLLDGQVKCRNSAGKELKTLPKAVRDSEPVEQLRQLVEWQAKHAREAREAVERWLIRSLPVPTALLSAVWPDQAWRATLTDLVVAPCDPSGAFDPERLGLLRQAGDGFVAVVNLDGETVKLETELVAVPHPVLLEELADLQEFAADLGVQQKVDQLFRQTFVRPERIAPDALSVQDYRSGKFDQLRFLLGRATSVGYQVRGGYASCRIVESGDSLEARFWLGEGDPWGTAWTGDLIFTTVQGHSIPLAKVGPVAWSEGHRMAAVIFAGRVTEKESEGEQD